MSILISDTSVLIDLERAHLIEAVFTLPMRFGVPDLLFDRELRSYGGDALLALGLEVMELDSAGVQLAQTYRAREVRISLPDAFALALAKGGTHDLLTGDGPLRALAEAELVPCHGVLWVFDQFAEKGSVSPAILHECLSLLFSHPRCRLPRKEVQVRLHQLAARSQG